MEVVLEEDDPSQRVRLVLGRQVTLKGRVFSLGGGIPGAKVLARSIGGTDLLLPNGVTDADGRFQLNLAEGAEQAELTILAPGFLFYQQIVAIPEADELPVVLKQVGGGTLVIQPRAAIDFRSGHALPYVVRDDGSRLDLLVLSQWSALHQAELDQMGRSGGTMEIAYSDDSDHPFRRKATSSLSESMWGPSSG